MRILLLWRETTDSLRKLASGKGCGNSLSGTKNTIRYKNDIAVEMNRKRDLGIPVPDYVDENVSDKVVKIIQSYTGVVYKMVWRKDV